jgi:hypothetical protein
VSMSPSEAKVNKFEQLWNELSDLLNKSYEKPDLQALRIILCVYIAHMDLQDKSIYLFINGAPGIGKTALAIKSIAWSEYVYPVSELSSNSFLSGFGEKTGILDNLPGKMGKGKTHGILTFSDFNNTILTQNPIKRNELVGQLRRIFDGEFEKKVGNKAKTLSWKGKVTCIAAVTPSIEDYWSLTRDLGERWLTVIWNGPESNDYFGRKKYSKKAMVKSGAEDNKTRERMEEIIKEIVKNSSPGGVILNEDSPYLETVASLVEIIEATRVTVHRSYQGTRSIITGVGDKQTSTRASITLASILKASTCLRNSKKIEKVDIDLIKKLAVDSIPIKRMNIIKHLVNRLPDPISHSDLFRLFRGPKVNFEAVLADLRALEIINPRVKPDKSDPYFKNILESVDNRPNEDDATGINTISLFPTFIKQLEEADIVNFMSQNYPSVL